MDQMLLLLIAANPRQLVIYEIIDCDVTHVTVLLDQEKSSRDFSCHQLISDCLRARVCESGTSVYKALADDDVFLSIPATSLRGHVGVDLFSVFSPVCSVLFKKRRRRRQRRRHVLLSEYLRVVGVSCARRLSDKFVVYSVLKSCLLYHYFSV